MNQLMWLDLEMTGLDPVEHKILEAGVIITDMNFAPLALDRWIIFQPEEELKKMDDWCIKTHTESGLLSKIIHGISITDLDSKLCELGKNHFKKDRIVLAGNSISQDRKFIDRYLPKFSELLHYRMMDVSAWKVWFELKHGLKFKKKNKHTALEDIQESIEEFKYYLGFVAIPEITR